MLNWPPMGEATNRPPVKLVLGTIYQDETLLQQALIQLQTLYGPIDFSLYGLPFSHTSYYQAEMGIHLQKSFFSFEHLIAPEDLVEIKLRTNQIENEYMIEKRRRINLDPGYLTAAKLILATTKNQRQRIYLSQGIYAEPELYFHDKSFTPWEWSYPDYCTPEYIAVFNQIRKIYQQQIKAQDLLFI